MQFNTPIFLFLYLPIVLLIYFCINPRFKNLFLLLASLFFYAWDKPSGIFILLLSIVSNYIFGLLIGSKREHRSLAQLILAVAIIINLSLLIYYKYINLFVSTLNQGLSLTGSGPITFPVVALPIGISFFTFHGLSYLIDIYRGDTIAQKSFIRVALYISLFPQLIAGPIIRYKNIAGQLIERIHTQAQFAEGVRRFIAGLGKKVLIATPLAYVADQIFALSASDMTFALAWTGIICYTFQIFFDFSGYTDMAIGLGKMFGFDFPENFNFPYAAQSIKDFWRRWHMSLSAWFRDYLYVPLGGNRQGIIRTKLNLLVVFFLVGLWHGASWAFVVWGLWHGAFLILERTAFGLVLEKMWRPLRHAYAMLVVVTGWVFFRSSNDFSYAIVYLKNMFFMGQWANPNAMTPMYFLNNEFFIVIFFAFVLSVPLCAPKEKMHFGKVLVYLGIFILSVMSMAQTTYTPFIYFRF
jgi:alginate O-acetyltransferase complex protein AlgI